MLVPGAYGAIGGIGQYCRDIAAAFAEMPEITRVTVIPREVQLSTEPFPDKVEFITEGARGKLSFMAAALRHAVPRPELLICGHVYMLPFALLLKGLTGAPLVLLVYGIDVWERQKRLSDQLLGTCDAIWSISATTCDRMNSWARLPIERFTILPNAIRLEHYGMGPASEPLQRRLGLIDRRIILTVARLPGFDRYKGVDEILECLPRLRQAVPNLTYLVVGDGPDRARLEAKVQHLGLSECVVFTGYVSEAEKAEYYRLADAFVMPGRGEGFGFVFLEALACGIPVVGSQLDGSKDALRGGMLGELADPRELTSVEAAVLKVLNKPKCIPEGLSYFAWQGFRDRLFAAARACLTVKSKSSADRTATH
jgi:phosphatidylinositol alpha-1,6-mannosyltransferase